MRRFGYFKGINEPQAIKAEPAARLADASVRPDRSGTRRRFTGKRKEHMPAYQGFTLIELIIVIAIIGILAALAVSSYFTYILRGQAAQTLSSYEHIRTVVNLETQVDGRSDLEAGSVPGEVPPALEKLLARTEFNQPYNTTLQLVKAPAGTFASFPTEDAYALIATTHNKPTGQLFLNALYRVLPHSGNNKLWLSESALYFPLDLGSGKTSTTPVEPAPPPSTGDTTPDWNDTETKDNGSTWDTQSRVCLKGSDGNLLSSDLNAQVQIRIVQEVRTWDGQSTERSWLTQVPITDGCATISLTGSPIAGPGTEGVSGLRFEVVDVLYYWPTDPAIKWDGKTPPLHVTAPK